MLKTWNNIKELLNIDKKATQKINCIRDGSLSFFRYNKIKITRKKTIKNTD